VRAGAQAPADPEAPEDLLGEISAVLPDGLGNDLESWIAWRMLDADQPIRARERAEAILARDPRSIGGHVVLGFAFYLGEGNLALARYHLRRAQQLFEEDHGLPPREGSPWLWHYRASSALAEVAGEMGRDAERLAVLEARDELYAFRPGDRGWTLMRLRRYGEARAMARLALELEDLPDQQAHARNTLCAVEAELLEREEALRWCMAAVELDAADPGKGALEYSNAGEAALGVLRLDEAERLYLEGTRHFVSGTPANPWLELAHLYVAQGRTGEARDAMREMLAWAERQPAYIDVQTRGAIDLAAATFLIAAGRPLEASRITARSIDRPDRQGNISFAARARHGAAALVDRVAHRSAAALRDEEASWLPRREAWRARLGALGHRLAAWWSGRRARALVAERRLLVHTVLPYATGSVVLPEWLQLETVEVAGPGAIRAALRAARATDPQADARGYLRAVEVELASRRGRPREAALAARSALDELPRAELLLRAHVAARGAQAALADGDDPLALELFDRALQWDPGVIRRLDLALPCVFESSGAAREAERMLRGSPRLRDAGFGFRVRTRERSGGSLEACLVGPTGARRACAEVTPERGEGRDETARRLAAALHERAFAPRVDLTQADLHSLDGATAAVGLRGAERVRRMLDEWRGESPAPEP
jgi:tetratricopeptide (TPR) repeat protein